ncbi:MAG: hypothetical protein JWO03_170 [Bacteroidetes bacterium]|nr:hypothetical protein [Bacteroidota bacterium]
MTGEGADRGQMQTITNQIISLPNTFYKQGS